MDVETRPRSLPEWLHWQETLNARPIELGLERVAQVALRLGIDPADEPPPATVVVAGTNGKGSTVRLLESVYAAAGYRTAAYTSPHLLNYNERVRIDMRPVSDRALCEAFEAVENARHGAALTYFEFGTLAALWLFRRETVAVRLLEVGLGGRLDAVNLVDADVAMIASIGLDHQDWLGPDREAIGFEKAGVMRGGRPAICGDRQPPHSLLDHARSCGARLLRLGTDFDWTPGRSGPGWRMGQRTLEPMPIPGIPGAVQMDNAACVIAAISLLQARLPVESAVLHAAIAAADLPGRLQCLGGSPEVWVDVGHNPDAMDALAGHLRNRPVAGRTRAVVGMLRDKAVEDSLARLAGLVDAWYPVCLPGSRCLPPGQLGLVLRRITPDRPVAPERQAAAAIDQALGDSAAGDRILVFGSFLTVAAALQHPRLGGAGE